MNPFHEELTEEEIKHRKMWKKLTREEKMYWIFNNVHDRNQTKLPIVYEEE